MVVLDCHLCKQCNGDPKTVPKQLLYEVMHKKKQKSSQQNDDMRLFPLVPQEIPKHMGGNKKGKIQR